MAADATQAGTGWGVTEWLLLLAAVALTIALVALVVRWVADARVRRVDERPPFTLTMLSRWLLVVAASLGVVFVLVVIWAVFGQLWPG